MLFDLGKINQTMQSYIDARTHTNLIDHIGLYEFRNHVSCIFYTKDIILSHWIDSSYRIFPNDNLVVGFTPTYPISKTNVTPNDNLKFIADCKRQLVEKVIDYQDANGTVLDFPASPGCFIVVVKSLADLDFVLNNQLSCLVVDARGKT